MDVQAYLAERVPLVDAVLEQAIGAAGAPGPLRDAMAHLVFPGGKRIRPGFAMAAAEALGRPPETALPIAAAVELIHTYSLIHDDLPCMDDDDERRGRPTVHIVHGEATAVLAGDALQSLAFEVLAEGADPAVVGGAVQDLARAIGAAGLVGGQVDDLAFAGVDGDAEAILSIHRRKTAALIAAAVVGGARLAGADEPRLARFATFGENVGIAFQIADDLLDADEDEGCTLLGVEDEVACRARAEALLAEALACVEDLGERAEPLRELARLSARRER